MISNQEDEELQVQKIIGERNTIKGHMQYRVLWKNYPVGSSTWESQYLLKNNHHLTQYKQKIKLSKQILSNQSQNLQKMTQCLSKFKKCIQIQNYNNCESNQQGQINEVQFSQNQKEQIVSNTNKNNLAKQDTLIVIEDDSIQDADNYDQSQIKKLMAFQNISKKIYKRRNKQGARVQYSVDVIDDSKIRIKKEIGHIFIKNTQYIKIFQQRSERKKDRNKQPSLTNLNNQVITNLNEKQNQ